ncbi:MAG: tRNA (adenosine(37)-N6)-dimethylallyltransferase MiaA [Flavobacteriales bacterium]|nr:tRNA (adenosine(37)-N6)-dimethylallyltransferase MiaA [Flavobacteriales bacterium]
MSLHKPVLIAVTGPTCSGKTDYAIQLAKHFNTEILSADSRQCYKELNIGTAKPSTDQLAEVKHHFIDHVSIHDTFNAGVYEREANKILDDLFVTNKVVIMAGGTGLYIDAVCKGLDDLPSANENLRTKYQEIFLEHGVDHLFSLLSSSDPLGAQSVDPKNPVRIMRALELVELTGKSIAELKSGNTSNRPFETIFIKMSIERNELYDRINARVDNMMADGLLEEVRSLEKFRSLKALQTVGYSELFSYIDGVYSLDEAVDKIKQHTRNYAKRQLTWMRKNHHYFESDKLEAADLEKMLY